MQKRPNNMSMKLEKYFFKLTLITRKKKATLKEMNKSALSVLNSQEFY